MPSTPPSTGPVIGSRRAAPAPGRPVPSDLPGRERAENFPVALRALPARVRADLRAVYGFARTVDELGDSAPGGPAARTALLRAFDAELARVWTGGPVVDPVLVALRPTVERHGLPAAPFHDLVRANLQDQVVTGYDTFEGLRRYCRLSADPVGRIVLAVFGQDSGPDSGQGSGRGSGQDDGRVALSDRVCTALQLLEHWQDVGEDHRAGRIYLPREDLDRFGVTGAELAADVAAGRAGAALAALLRFETERAAALLEEGAPLVGLLHGWARPCVAGFVAGGRATVAALRRSGGDVLARPTTPSRAGTLVRLVGLAVRGR